MLNVDLNNPADVRNAGMKVLREALGPVGMVKFIKQFDLGYGDYTEEKYERPDISLDDIDAILKRYYIYGYTFAERV